ncbi:hypothetical protein BDA99DRAFT_559572 [Phascolomyces articulosus]|uniref:F-box domain-containing protein n=1 Tax=Phascolomyces articulosus TaxID=60185 RepID=A0AAD5K165_9FUNG|nr:hypothetical protein BDA99DRAFT_559572 [Phascolomyces articulosus]
MSIFKQAQNAILSTFSTRQDALSSFATLNEHMDKKTRYEIEQKKAQEKIRRSPNSGEGYFISVLLYHEQNDLSSALDMCLKGLECISPKKYPHHYTQLQKEKEIILEKQARYGRNGFFDILPYDVVCEIFQHIRYRDLLHCIGVCQDWFDFIMNEYPYFWHRLMPEQMSSEHKSLTDPLVRHESQEFRLESGDPNDLNVVENNSVLLPMLWNSHSIRKLYYRFPRHWSSKDLWNIYAVIRSLSLTLKQLDIICCKIDPDDILSHLMGVCFSNLTHVSVTQSEMKEIDNTNTPADLTTCSKKNRVVTLKWIPLEMLGKTRVSSAPFFSASQCYYATLTYLKLCNYHEFMQPDPLLNSRFGRLAGSAAAESRVRSMLFSDVPNLIHLFIGWVDIYNHDLVPFYQETTKSCPRLRNLVVTHTASMPPTIQSDIDPSEYENSDIIATTTTTTNKATTEGLRRFVLTGCNRSREQKNVIPIFKKHHATFELLYLDYDNLGVGPMALTKLASLGCPHLRELRLCSVSRMLRKPSLDKNKKSATPATSTVLVQLFSVCPALQVIELSQELFTNSELALEINAEVLETIAQKCSQLLYFSYHSESPRLHIGGGGYACKNFLCFTDNHNNIGNDNTTTNATEQGGKNGSVHKKQKQRSSLLQSSKQEQHVNSRLECLKVPHMDHETALTLVENLGSLKHFEIFKWYYYHPKDTTTTTTATTTTSTRRENNSGILMEPVKEILESRGGSLVLG